MSRHRAWIRAAARLRLALVLTAAALVLSACGSWRSFDAQGLQFEYPEQFTEAEGTNRSTLILRSERPERGVIAVRWSEGSQPDARAVLTAALEAAGVDGQTYDSLHFERIDTVEVDGRKADYVEFLLKAGTGDDRAPYFGRVLLFNGPNGYRYLVGYVVADSHRSDPEVVDIWERFRATLRFADAQ